MAVFKVAVTDSVFPNLDTGRAILAREGAELTASQYRSIADLQRLAAEEVARALRGERPKMLANPEVWPQVQWKQQG